MRFSAPVITVIVIVLLVSISILVYNLFYKEPGVAVTSLPVNTTSSTPDNSSVVNNSPKLGNEVDDSVASGGGGFRTWLLIGLIVLVLGVVAYKFRGKRAIAGRASRQQCADFARDQLLRMQRDIEPELEPVYNKRISTKEKDLGWAFAFVRVGAGLNYTDPHNLFWCVVDDAILEIVHTPMLPMSERAFNSFLRAQRFAHESVPDFPVASEREDTLFDFFTPEVSLKQK